MADRWILIDNAGSRYELPPTFSAPQYEAGGVDFGALLRREESRTYQRSGDGLRTPGPLILNGIIFRDNFDVNAMRDELDAIQAAVLTCATVERRTSRSITTYSDLAGGPTIEIYPDGLAGYTLALELWPGRAQAVTIPTVTPTTRIALYIDGSGSMDPEIPILMEAMQLLIARLDAEVYHGTASQYVTASVTTGVQAGERWVSFGALLPDDDVIAIVAINESNPIYHAIPRNIANEPTSAFLSDYALYLNRVNTTFRRRMTLYVVPTAGSTGQAFAGHVQDAYGGLNGYPQALSTLGMELRLNVPAAASAEWYANDMWEVIF